MVEDSDSFHRVALPSPRPLEHYFSQQMGRKDENDIPASRLFLPGSDMLLVQAYHIGMKWPQLDERGERAVESRLRNTNAHGQLFPNNHPLLWDE